MSDDAAAEDDAVEEAAVVLSALVEEAAVLSALVEDDVVVVSCFVEDAAAVLSDFAEDADADELDASPQAASERIIAAASAIPVTFLNSFIFPPYMHPEAECIPVICDMNPFESKATFPGRPMLPAASGSRVMLQRQQHTPPVTVILTRIFLRFNTFRFVDRK